MNDVYILSAARTAIGKFGGGLSTVPATDLGATAIRAAVERLAGPDQMGDLFKVLAVGSSGLPEPGDGLAD